MNLGLRTWGQYIERLAPDHPPERCSGVQPKKGEPRCQATAVYRGFACYVTGPRGRHGTRSFCFCASCAEKWARWMEIEIPPIKMDDLDAADVGDELTCLPF